MRGLQGKRAIITGGAQGIGRACMEAFIEYDCTVVFSDLEEETGTATQAELRSQGADVHFIHGDLGIEESCEQQVILIPKNWLL